MGMSYQTVSSADDTWRGDLRRDNYDFQHYHHEDMSCPDDNTSLKVGPSSKATEGFHQNISDDHNVHATASTSTWKIGWKLPVAMVAFYILAMVVAVANLLMFHFLDGRHTEGPDSFPQAYVTSGSILLANFFQASLASSLAIAFTQHLWRVLRTTPLTISNIDLLHRVRKEILPLLDPRTLATTPLLYLMALFIWLLSIVKIFPPGALTVISQATTRVETLAVPTYDSRYLGNHSYYAADYLSTHIFSASYSSDLATIDQLSYGGIKLSILQVAVSTLTSGDVLASTSPCGANCSYTTTFEGPYLSCTDRFHNETGGYETVDVYAGAWNGDAGPNLNGGPGSPPSFVDLQMNLTSPVGAFSDNGADPDITVRSVRHITCQPSRATYTLNVTFVNGKRILSHTAQELGSIEAVFHADGVAVNCPPGAFVPEPTITMTTLILVTSTLASVTPTLYTSMPSITLSMPVTSTPASVTSPPSTTMSSSTSVATPSLCRDDVPMEWNEAAIDNFSDLNIYAFIDCLATVLGGAYPAAIGSDSTVIGTWTLPDGKVVNLYKLEFVYFTGDASFETTPSQILLRVNVFNSNRDLTLPGPNYTITQDLLNEALANITFGTMLTHNNWMDSIDVTKTTYGNVYSFSRPLNLILPYFIPLLIAPIYLAIGAYSLRLNGVPAMDDSFVQLLMTSTGSRALEKTAAAGCLGGAENIPPGMKKLKVRFGELDMGTDASNTVRRAGFGLEGEVRPLRRDTLYGVAD